MKENTFCCILLGEKKEEMEEAIRNKINSFHIQRGKENFKSTIKPLDFKST